MAACCWAYCRVKQTLCHVRFSVFSVRCYFKCMSSAIMLNIYGGVCICSSARQKLPQLISPCVVLSFRKCGAYSSSPRSLHIDLTTVALNKTCYKLLYWVHPCVRVCVSGVAFDGYSNTGCVICSIWVGLPVGFWFIMAGQSGKSIQRSAVGDSSAVTCADRRQSKWFTTPPSGHVTASLKRGEWFHSPTKPICKNV